GILRVFSGEGDSSLHFVPRKNTAKSRSRGLDPLASPSIHPRSLACLLMGFESRAAIQQGSRDHQECVCITLCTYDGCEMSSHKKQEKSSGICWMVHHRCDRSDIAGEQDVLGMSTTSPPPSAAPYFRGTISHQQKKKKKVYVPLPFTLVNSLIVLCLRSVSSIVSFSSTYFIHWPYMLPTRRSPLGLDSATQSHATTEKVVPQ
ncbi:unnamed protein product, partial [Musa hybrid cultivar]